MCNDEGIFTVINEEGQEIECEILFTFDSDKFEKSYVIYFELSD